MCRNINPYVANSFANWGVAHRLPIQSAPCAAALAGTSSFGMSGVNAHAIISRADENPSTAYAAVLPWQRSQRCFVEVLTRCHPLLRTAAPAARHIHFKVPLGRPSLAFFWDHQVIGTAILPGAAYLEASAAAAATLARVPAAPAAVVGAAILAPLVLPPAGPATAMHLVAEVELASGVISIRSGTAASTAAETSHLKGTLVKVGRVAEGSTLSPAAAPAASLEVARAACTEPQAASGVYDGMRGAGLQYGPAFRYGAVCIIIKWCLDFCLNCSSTDLSLLL